MPAPKVTLIYGPYVAPARVITAVKDADEATDLRTVCVGSGEPVIDDDGKPVLDEAGAEVLSVHPPVKVNQIYRCTHCYREEKSYHPFPRGRDNGDNTFTVLTAEELNAAIVDPDVKKTLTLMAAPREQVDAQALPSGKFYYVGPENGPGAQNYALIRDVIRATPDKAWITTWAYRSVANMIRFSLVGDVIGFQQLAWPAAVQMAPNVAVPAYDERFFPIALSTADILTVDFDPAKFVDTRKAKIAEMLALMGATPAVGPAPSTRVQGSTDALLAEMQRWVEERGGSVGGASKTAPKKRTRKPAAAKKDEQPAAEVTVITPRKAAAKRAPRKKVSA